MGVLCKILDKELNQKTSQPIRILDTENTAKREKGRALPNSKENAKWLSKQLKISQENVHI